VNVFVSVFAVDPVTSTTIYAGTFGSGVFQSAPVRCKT